MSASISHLGRVICVASLCVSLTSLAGAGVTWSGDIDPADPTTWTAGATDGYIGKTSSGALFITAGGAVGDWRGLIGFGAAATGEVTVDGDGSSWTHRGPSIPGQSEDGLLYVGEYGSGTLNITNGGTVNSDFTWIAHRAGSTGEVTVDGAGSTWDNGIWGSIYVGYEGDGVLNITNGGAVNNCYGHIGYKSGSTGEVTVDGAGSTWDNGHGYVRVGCEGSGVLNITNGGVVDAGYYLRVGSSGTVNFGNGTLTTDGLIAALDDLTGAGTINAGGLVMDVDLVFDATHGLSQTIIVNGLPGQNITINLAVGADTSYMGAGYSGVGTMSISDGRAVQSRSGYIGYCSGSTGEVTIDGAGSTWDVSGIAIGLAGCGVLNITDGGAATNGNHYYSSSIGALSGSVGEVTVDGPGSRWTTGVQRFYIGHEGYGVLNITNGGMVDSPSPHGAIGASAGSTGEVTVDGAGSKWEITEEFSVGDEGNGVLNITNGGMVSVGEALAIDVAGGGSSTVNMATGGMLALYGQADSSLAAFLDLIGGTGPIRYWDQDTSSWADITGATMGEDYWLEYHTAGDLAGYTVLTVGEPLGNADLDGDGFVGQADLDIILSAWGEAVAPNSTPDPSGDGLVGQDDLDIVLDNWGNGIPPGAGSPTGGASSSGEILSLPSTLADQEQAETQEAPTAKELRRAKRAARRAARAARRK